MKESIQYRVLLKLSQMIAVATATLRDSAWPKLGMVILYAMRLATSGETPLDSFPITRIPSGVSWVW